MPYSSKIRTASIDSGYFSDTSLGEGSDALSTTSTARHVFSEHGKSTLFSLPIEIRSAIYTATLSKAGDNNLALLRTCEQIYLEASPLLYQLPVHFHSQMELYSWVERSAESNLKQVRSLTIHMADIDLGILFALTPTKGNRQPGAWSLYQKELRRLDTVLRSLPGVVKLTVIPPERNNSQLLSGVYLSFLTMIPERLPKLARLTIHDHESALVGKIPGLQDLKNIIYEEPESHRSLSRMSINQSGKKAWKLSGRTLN